MGSRGAILSRALPFLEYAYCGPMSIFSELKRRNVFRVATAYVVTAWLAIQVADTLLPILGFDAAAARLVVILLAIGLVPTLAFAWAFEFTPEGLKREGEVDHSKLITPRAGKKLDRLIMMVLALALGYFAFDKFALEPSRDAAREADMVRRARGDALVESYGDRSIAVLPFVNMSGDADQEYFSDGIAEEMLNLLAQISELRVISRSSSFSFKGRDLEIPEIAERLNVGHVLEGSVRKSGNRIRITAQLIDARTDTHLWSANYDRELDDIFAIQDEIATTIVEQLKLTLLSGVPTSRPTDPEAYVLFLQGRHLLDRYTRESLVRAGGLYQRVLDIDPNYPPALKGLAEVLANQTGMGLIPMEGSIERAWALVGRAAALDPGYADAWSGLGSMHQYWSGDLQAAAENFARAVELGPNQASIMGDAGIFAIYLGRLEQAMALLQRQVELDPISPTGYDQLGRVLLGAGRMDEALAQYRTVLDLSPDRVGAHFTMGAAHLLKGDYDSALAAMENEPYEPIRLAGLSIVQHSMHNTDASDTALSELIEKYTDEADYIIGYTHAWRGETDLAFEALARAEQSGEPMAALNITPWFESIKSDPRWDEMLERLGLSAEQLAGIRFDIELPD